MYSYKYLIVPLNVGKAKKIIWKQSTVKLNPPTKAQVSKTLTWRKKQKNLSVIKELVSIHVIIFKIYKYDDLTKKKGLTTYLIK